MPPPPPQSAPLPGADAPALTRRQLLGYGAGSVGTGVFSAVPGLLLLFYLTDVLGVPAAAAGLVLVLPKAWDVLLNPVVGVFSDREAARTGRRTRLLTAGALALPVPFALMFAAPAGGAPGGLWSAAAFLAAASAFALFQVPYVALPAEISDRADQRSRAMAWRVVFLTAGILVAGGLAPAVVSAAGGGRAGHAAMGAAVALVIGAAMAFAAHSTRWIRARPGARPLGPAAAFRAARGNRAFAALVGAFALQALAVAVLLAGAPYAAAYRLGDYALTSVLFVCVVGPSMAAVPVWQAAARRFGAKDCYVAAVLLVAAAAAALFPALQAAAAPAVYALTAAAGVGYAGLQLLPLSLLPETVLADAERSGQAQSGTFTGVWTAAETGAMALGPALFSAVLAAAAYRSGGQGAEAAAESGLGQTAAALTGLTAGFALLPAALLALSLLPLAAYRRRTGGPGAAGPVPPAPTAQERP